jgi:hypothetical protein
MGLDQDLFGRDVDLGDQSMILIMSARIAVMITLLVSASAPIHPFCLPSASTLSRL